MSANFRRKPAGQNEIALYSLIGEAVCMLQILEEALSYSLTLKNDVKRPDAMSKERADELLDRCYCISRSNTF